MRFVLLITAAPEHSNAWHARHFAEAALSAGHSVLPFFYGNAVRTANRLACPPQDEPDLGALWAGLAESHDVELPVCVAAALRRGVTDGDNAQRHHLHGDNLHPAFTLAGLGQLVEALSGADRILSFVD